MFVFTEFNHAVPLLHTLNFGYSEESLPDQQIDRTLNQFF
jgi:hypothetical protein